jgi:hypothetical protein
MVKRLIYDKCRQMTAKQVNTKVIVACKVLAYVHVLSLRSGLKRKRLPLGDLLVRCLKLCSNFILLNSKIITALERISDVAQ